MSSVPRCGDAGGRTADGSPCGVFLGLDEETGLCLSHDPERKEEAIEVRRKGAHAKAEADRRRKAARPKDVPKAPRSLADAEKVASWITFAVLTGEIDVRVAEAGTKAVRQFQLTIEKRALQDRVRLLEKRLKQAERSP